MSLFHLIDKALKSICDLFSEERAKQHVSLYFFLWVGSVSQSCSCKWRNGCPANEKDGMERRRRLGEK